jgi:hypothetical protein
LITPAGWLYQNVDGVAESWHKHGFWLFVVPGKEDAGMISM